MKLTGRMVCILLILPSCLWAQQGKEHVMGKVVEETPEGKSGPLVGANVYWAGTSIGTITDAKGMFHLQKIEETNKLVVSYIGYQNDTLDPGNKEFINVALKASVALDEVEIIRRQKSTVISMIDPIKVERIGENELLKAACCNLSESFETSPSVDVTFTDAITGTRQIQMLGLAGPYTQITRENMPDIYGLSAIYGLTYVPGTWVESIQLNKGTGSVANGYGSIAGQINVELRKPETAGRLYLNAYGNEEGRMEGNAHLAYKFKENRWSSALLLHGKNNSVKWDKNHDGFLDQPLGNQVIGLNRWNYIGSHGIRMQFGVKGTYIDNLGGQRDFNPESDVYTSNSWGMHLNMQRLEGWTKMGRVYENSPWKSMGLQLSGASHRQDSYFGMRKYDATQNSFYTNFIYQNIFGNTNHKFRTGASFQYDDYKEALNDTTYNYTEIVPGIYFEYTYSHLENFNLVAGIRADHHNLYGAFLTPRLHLRYAITGKTVLRASAGRGLRSANILSENNGLLASSRQFVIPGDGSRKPYGLNPEVAWNYGLNLTQKFKMDYREGSISFDFYRTDFINQIVVDLDQSPQLALFYNLKGKSYSNSFQAQIDYEIIKRLDARLAYRWYDVHTAYQGKLMQKPLVASHRAFLNLAYHTRNHWKFDYTVNWQGQKRIPFTDSNPEEYRLPKHSPSFVMMNVQISKSWREKLEVYAGVENLLDFKQKDPILSSDQPFSPYFDSFLVWGPIFGRNIYAGLRYRIK